MESNHQMRSVWIAVALLTALLGLDRAYRTGGQSWVHPVRTGEGPARILRFYPSAGAVAPGQPVRLCYAVENARTVRISPLVNGVYPARNYCLQVAPEHTMHFTLWAEGYDGSIAARSFTLPVQTVPEFVPAPVLSVAAM